MMLIQLTQTEQKLLAQKGIEYSSMKELTDTEALELLNKVREVEIQFSQAEDFFSKNQFYAYQKIADKIHQQIPD